MTIRDLTAGRVREANTTITAVLMAPCGLACAGTVVPGLDQTVTLVLFALGALALAALGLRWTARWVRECAEDRADAHTAAIWQAEHAPHLLNATDRAHLTARLSAPLVASTGWGWS
jgi:hypothetical protein